MHTGSGSGFYLSWSPGAAARPLADNETCTLNGPYRLCRVRNTVQVVDQRNNIHGPTITVGEQAREPIGFDPLYQVLLTYAPGGSPSTDYNPSYRSTT